MTSMCIDSFEVLTEVMGESVKTFSKLLCKISGLTAAHMCCSASLGLLMITHKIPCRFKNFFYDMKKPCMSDLVTQFLC